MLQDLALHESIIANFKRRAKLEIFVLELATPLTTKTKLKTYSYNATMSPSEDRLSFSHDLTTSRGLPTPSLSAGSLATQRVTKRY